MTARRTGIVQNVLDARTVSVLVQRLVTHPKYGKAYHRSKSYLADVLPGTTLHVGDKVSLESVRPISARKHWRVATVVSAGHTVVQSTDGTEELA